MAAEERYWRTIFQLTRSTLTCQGAGYRRSGNTECSSTESVLEGVSNGCSGRKRIDTIGTGVRDDDVSESRAGIGRSCKTASNGCGSPHGYSRSCSSSQSLGVDLEGVWGCGGVLLPADLAVALGSPDAVLVVLALQLLAEVVVLDGVGDPSEVLDTVCGGSEGSCSI